MVGFGVDPAQQALAVQRLLDRYQWLRDHCLLAQKRKDGTTLHSLMFTWTGEQSLDEAVDEARAKKP